MNCITRKISKAQFVQKKNEEISENYEDIEILGQGAFSIVILVKNRKSGTLCCVKKINKAKFTKA